MAKSSRPSPLKSAVTIVPGWFTITGDVVAENVPSPFPNRIVTVLSLRFTTARSSSPSLLKSPRTSVKGPCPTGTGEPEAALNVPSPLPSRMLTMFPIPSLTAKSALPSLLKSAATMPVAKKPTGIGEPGAGVNVPSPLPSSTTTPLGWETVTARSRFPSPLKSPTVTVAGYVAAAGGLAGRKPIHLSVGVEVAYAHAKRSGHHRNGLAVCARERSVPFAQKDVDTWCGGERTGKSKVGDAITIKVRRDHVPEDAPQGEG